MNAQDFKTGLKQISSQLKGVTLQMVSGGNTTPHYTMASFGAAVLEAEANDEQLFITRAWTSEGVVPVQTFEQLAALLRTGKVTGIGFKARYVATNLTDYINNVLKTTE